MTLRCDWARCDSAGAIPKRYLGCRARRRLFSRLWPTDGSRWLHGAHFTFVWYLSSCWLLQIYTLHHRLRCWFLPRLFSMLSLTRNRLDVCEGDSCWFLYSFVDSHGHDLDDMLVPWQKRNGSEEWIHRILIGLSSGWDPLQSCAVW